MAVVKCVYEFQGEADTDLSLFIGDLVKVTKVINDDWYEGALNGRVGQFPKAFVEECQDVFDLGIGTGTFEAEQEGDLSIKVGELIVITEVVDGSWMKGYAQGGKHGMFPQSFVKSISIDGGSNAAKAVSNETENDKPNLVVEVLHDFAAQSSNEINIIAGSTVEILSEVDEFWCEGRTEDGMQGMFPRDFVDLPGSMTPELKSNQEIEKEVDNKEEYDSHNIEGSYPEEIAVTSYGEAIAEFDYFSDMDGDLHFSKGDTIILLEKIDDNWFKGQVAGQTGMFPSSYVTVSFSNTGNESYVIQQKATQSQSIQKTQPLQKPAKPQQPKKPAKPQPPNFKALSSDTTEIGSVAKKKPPSRPKQPKKKNDELPFVFQFNTRNQPTVIIPPAYLKAGQQNILLKEPRDLSSNGNDQLRAYSPVPSPGISPSSSMNHVPKDTINVASRTDKGLSPSSYGHNISTGASSAVSGRLQTRKPVTGKKISPKSSMNNVYQADDYSPTGLPSLAQSSAANVSSSFGNMGQQRNSESTHEYTSKAQNFGTKLKSESSLFGNMGQQRNSENTHEYTAKVQNFGTNIKSESSLFGNMGQQRNSENTHEYTAKAQNFGATMKSEYQSVNKNIPNENMSTYQKMKCANNNLNTVVTVANAVGIKTTKTQVAKGAVKMGAGAYLTGSQTSKGGKPVPPLKSVTSKSFSKFSSK